MLTIVSFSALVVLILWLDNAQGGLTGNGIFKSIELKPWIVDPAHAPLFAANYFWYPAYGTLCRLLDALGVMTGDPRRQITILNAASAALCLCVIYSFVRALTGDRLVAWLSALFHIACCYVLTLAIVNEDIMPSYTIMLAAMALGSLWFARPTALRVLAVSALFSLGWLFEWRLMFPALPALLLALAVCERRWPFKALWLLLFGAGMLATAAVAAWATRGHDSAQSALELIWTGKAVDSAWAGFSWAKIGYLADGLAGYLLGTAITQYDWLPGWDIWRYTAVVGALLLLIASVRLLWRRRDDPVSWSLSAIFGGTFFAGEVFNLYSQPQDPQMQINVLPWLTVGWALALVAARSRRQTHGLVTLVGLSVALLAYNVWSFAPQRGVDTAWRTAFETIERKSDPAKSVFLVHVFDWMPVYASLYWGKQTFGTETLGRAPQTEPKFKWISFAYDALWHPDWSDDRQIADMESQIDEALALGYDVLSVRIWRLDERQLEKDTNTIASSQRVKRLHDALHRDYEAIPAFDDPVLGPVDRLQHRR